MRTQRWTLVVVCVATAMLMLDIAVVNTALSRIAADLDTGLSGLQWVVDAYTLALASVVLTAGSLADRLGRRRLFTIGLAIFTVASALCALATDIVFLNSSRAVQGVGAAIMFAVSLSLLANAYPGGKERAGALAAYGATIGASFAVGPLVGGVLTSALDWQWIFLINVPIGIASLYVTRRYVQESRDPNAHGIDWAGQATLSAGLFLLVLALLRGNEQGWTSTPIVLELAGAVVALVAFVAVERRVKQPMLPLRFFRDPSFTGAQVAAFAISASFFAIFLYTTIYMQQVLGLSAIEAGLAYLPGTVVMLFVSGATASIGARVPARTMIGGGLALVAIGMGLFMLADAESSWTMILPGLLVACIGTGVFNPALTNVALGSVPQEQSGVAAGVNDTYRQAGIAVGVAALGALIPAEHAFSGADPEAYVSGFHDALLAGGILAAVGALAAWLLISKSYGAAAPAPVDAQPASPAGTVPAERHPVAPRPALEAA
jgi:EmrB/QacA subfamily drug resistance transporter